MIKELGHKLGYRIFGQVINRVRKIAKFGHKLGKGFGKLAAQPYPFFLGVPPPGSTQSEELNVIGIPQRIGTS